MITTAAGCESRSKFVILPWAGWVFIAVDTAVHVMVVAFVVWIVQSAAEIGAEGEEEEETGVVEVDGIRAAKRARVYYSVRKRDGVGRWGTTVWRAVLRVF